MDSAGLRWLESLRDPLLFATKVDSLAVLYFALAHEVAGNIAEARTGYEAMLHRLRTILGLGLNEREVLQKYAKTLIFVARKLGLNGELASEFSKKLNWFPKITPLPAAS